MILTATSSYAFGDEKEFESWWTQAETLRPPSPEQLKEGARYYQKMIKLKFTDLKKYSAPIRKPKALKNPMGEVFLLFEERESVVLLITPENIVKGAKVGDKNADLIMSKCNSDKSLIATLPENSWSEIDLSPYCLEFYGFNRKDIDIQLYWVGYFQKPLIEIITNGPACVPHDLYGWDVKMKRYRKIAQKCTA